MAYRPLKLLADKSARQLSKINHFRVLARTASSGSVVVWMIPTSEERTIAHYTQALL
jgi:hypothetical protein